MKYKHHSDIATQAINMRTGLEYYYSNVDEVGFAQKKACHLPSHWRKEKYVLKLLLSRMARVQST